MAPKLPKRVSVAVTPREMRALVWMAKELNLRRYPTPDKETTWWRKLRGKGGLKRPGAGAVLRIMSIEEAVRRYDTAHPKVKKPGDD